MTVAKRIKPCCYNESKAQKPAAMDSCLVGPQQDGIAGRWALGAHLTNRLNYYSICIINIRSVKVGIFLEHQICLINLILITYTWQIIKKLMKQIKKVSLEFIASCAKYLKSFLGHKQKLKVELTILVHSQNFDILNKCFHFMLFTYHFDSLDTTSNIGNWEMLEFYTKQDLTVKRFNI